MTTFYLVSQDQHDYSWELADTMMIENTTNWQYLGNKFIKKLGIDAKADRDGSFVYNHKLYIVVDEFDWNNHYSKEVSVNREAED